MSRQRKKIVAVKRDPSDDKLFECALEAKAEYIASYDPGVLELKTFRTIAVLKPENLLEKLNL